MSSAEGKYAVGFVGIGMMGLPMAKRIAMHGYPLYVHDSSESALKAICTVSGATITAVAAGTCIIAANQAGNSNSTAAPQVTQNITVTSSPNNGTACGDVNKDGKLDIFDALLTLQYGLNLISHDVTNNAKFLPAGDVAPFDVTTSTVIGDGKIDVFDALVILQASVNLVRLPPCTPTQAVLKLKTTGALASGKQMGGWAATIKMPVSGVTIKNKYGALDSTAFTKSGVTPSTAVFSGSFNPADATSAVPYLMVSSLGDPSDPTNGSGLGEIATLTFDITSGFTAPVKSDFVISNFSAASAESGAPPLSGITMIFDLVLK